VPEGDTVYRTAKHLNEVMAGTVLTRCDIRVPEFATVDLTGETVNEVVSVGKHLLTRVGDYSIHSHLKMEGSWHIYARGSRWRRPAFEARAILDNAEWSTVGFSLGVLEVLPLAQEADAVGHLGPDLLGPGWDADEAVRRVTADADRAIGLAILDQRNMAGLGNVYRAELCFVRGLLPTRPVRDVPDVPGLVALSRRVIWANKDRNERSLTGDLRRGRTSYVYGREGKPCLRCGTPILRGELGDPVRPGQGSQDRVVYWCPRCQT